ncbi:hypothetical protein [Stenotrophomonas muris]|uniref:hypothetical protein n=1 Tax=Stenotrophomonas muris TaxID=2963283 RepID=UPI002E798610|nr:hypothetical protein [Stenotrophomonas muris]
MSNDYKTLADVQPGGRVRLGDAPWPEIDAILADAYSAGAEGLPFEGIARRAAVRKAVAALSAQPSPGGQGDARLLADVDERVATAKALGYEDDIGVGIGLLQCVRSALAARQPVGEPVSAARPGNRVGMLEAACGPDRKFDPAAADTELASIPLVPLWDLPELHPRKVADECLTTMERARQSTKPHTANRVRLTDAIELTGRFIESLERSERLGTAPPAQAVDLDAMRALLQRRIEQWRSHLPADPGAPGTREIETKGEHDYNNDVRIYREGIAVMEEVLSKIDSQAVGNG